LKKKTKKKSLRAQQYNIIQKLKKPQKRKKNRRNKRVFHEEEFDSCGWQCKMSLKKAKNNSTDTTLKGIAGGAPRITVGNLQCS